MALNTKGFEQFLKMSEQEQADAMGALAAKNSKAMDQGAKASQEAYDEEQMMRRKEEDDMKAAIAMSEAQAKIERAKQGEEEYQY